jgi:hypothetical protein
MSTRSSAEPTHGAWIPEEAKEHLRAAHRELHAGVEALLPPAFIEHRKAARRSVLLAARSWIDHCLAGLGETPRT